MKEFNYWLDPEFIIPIKLTEDQMTAYRYIIFRKKTGTKISGGTLIAPTEAAAKMKVAQEHLDVDFASPKIVFILREF